MDLHQIIITFIVIFSNNILPSLCNLQDNNNNENNVRILLFGTSGCGKSSTINLLLNQNIKSLVNTNSTNSRIDEYGIYFNGIGNITIIDTPGISDVNGLESGSQIIASLQHFLETSNDKAAAGQLPDIILLYHRFDDNKFDEEMSTFIKMVKYIASINHWLNLENTNIGLLLTRAGTIVSSANAADDKIQDFTIATEEYLKAVSPSTEIDVILAENKPKDAGLLIENSTEFNIPSYIIQINSYSNQSYPENLCQFFKKAVHKNPTKVKLVQLLSQRKFSSLALVNTFELLSSSDTKVQAITKHLIKINQNISTTPVSVKLSSTYQQKYQNSSILLQEDLVYIQKALNLRGIINVEDFPKTNVQVSSLFQIWEINDDYLKFLETTFQFTLPKLPMNILQVGLQYNFEQTDFAPKSMFDMEKFEPSTIGYGIPKQASCSLVALSNRIWLTEETVVDEIIIPSTNIHYTFIYCQLQDNVEISTEFITRLNNLPNFNETDLQNIFQWKMFFDEFGAYLVTEAYIGGSINVYNNESRLANLTDISSLSDLLTRLSLLNDLTDWKVKITGGNTKYYTSSLQIMLTNNANLFTSWIKSTPDNLITTSLNFIPIETYLESNGFAIQADKILEAKEYFTNLSPNKFEQTLIEKITELEFEKHEIIQKYKTALALNEACRQT